MTKKVVKHAGAVLVAMVLRLSLAQAQSADALAYSLFDPAPNDEYVALPGGFRAMKCTREHGGASHVWEVRREGRGFDLYCQLMDAPGGISRRERVLIATVVSAVNGCHY